jgi:hypothetical protein
MGYGEFQLFSEQLNIGERGVRLGAADIIAVILGKLRSARLQLLVLFTFALYFHSRLWQADSYLILESQDQEEIEVSFRKNYAEGAG